MSDSTIPVSCFLDTRHQLGEGPVMDAAAGRLYWCDILGQTVHALDWDSRTRHQWRFDATVGSIGLTDDDRLIVALRDEIILFDPKNGATEPLCTIEADNPRSRLNDGKTGPDGAFWVGTMDDIQPRRPLGALYRISAGGAVRQITDGLKISNGLAWSPDGRVMYHADTGPGRVDRWDFDVASGAASNRRTFIELSDEAGRPDGAAVDIEGNYWSAGVSAGKLNCISAQGKITRAIALPIPRPTMPCFAGPGHSHLIVTSLRAGCDEASLAAHPQSGSLFSLQPGISGLPASRFRTAG